MSSDSTSDSTIKSGDWVVLDCSDGKKLFALVNETALARLGKRKHKTAPLLGHRHGDQFAIRGRDGLVLVNDEAQPQEADDPPDESHMASEKNNQFLRDTTANQTLEQDAIDGLKQSGVRGEALVQKVAQHSATFKDKTAFSQTKYLARKRAKFDLRVRVVRPTAASLCDAYFHKSPEKTLHLRVDALAMMLAYANVRAGASVLLYENCTGLLTAAVAERLAGQGSIINLFAGANPPGAEVVRMLNLSQDHARIVAHTPVQLLDHVDEDERNDGEPLKYIPSDPRTQAKIEAEAEAEAKAEGAEAADGDAKAGKGIPQPDTKDEKADAEERKEHLPSARRAEAIAQRPRRGAIKQWLRAGVDCLLVATRYDVVTVFDALLRHVAPAGCFAAYCTHLQDASDLQYALQLSKMAVRIELWESSLVQHQVLPGRTHPAMTDSATGGFVVTGVRIETAPLD